jgi:hypothetical protein
MALIEQRVLKQISVLPLSKTIDVQWADQIVKDGTVISEQYHRKAYSANQKDEFLAEVESAAFYVSAVGWQNA